MHYENTSKQDYQTFLDILSEMVSTYMEKQTQKGDGRCARDDATIQQSKQSSTD